MDSLITTPHRLIGATKKALGKNRAIPSTHKKAPGKNRAIPSTHKKALGKNRGRV